MRMWSSIVVIPQEVGSLHHKDFSPLSWWLIALLSNFTKEIKKAIVDDKKPD